MDIFSVNYGENLQTRQNYREKSFIVQGPGGKLLIIKSNCTIWYLNQTSAIETVHWNASVANCNWSRISEL